MTIDEAPPWIKEFLQKKAPWWLEKGANYLTVTFVDHHRHVAQVFKDGYTYTLIPEQQRIVLSIHSKWE